MQDPHVKFMYDIKIGVGANLLQVGKLADVLPHAGEMVITSKEFATYEECEKSLSSVMTFLAHSESRATEKNHVIVTKVNPAIDDSGKLHADTGSWDKFTILRAYVADSEQLKKAQLHYHVFGQIRTNYELTLAKQDK